MSNSADKMRKYKQAYKKCIDGCSLEKNNKRSDGGKKKCEHSNFLHFDFAMNNDEEKKKKSKKKSIKRKKSPSKTKSVSKYNLFVKKHYNKFRSLEKKKRFAEIAKLWKKEKNKKN